MKPLAIAAALATIVTMPAMADTYYIDQPDGQLILNERSCQSGGFEATFISSAYDGGAYGCWIRQGDKVLIQWTMLLGANGSILDTNMRAVLDKPASMR